MEQIGENQLTWNEFVKVEMRVGTIVSAEKYKKQCSAHSFCSAHHKQFNGAKYHNKTFYNKSWLAAN